MGTLILGIVVIVVVWIAFCVRIVSEDERAIKVFLGKPGITVSSGLRFIFWPFQKLVVYSTKQQELEIPERSVITKTGKFGDEGEKEENKHTHGAASIIVKAVVYFFWPDDLKQAVTKGPNPNSKEKMIDFFEEATADALRVAAGGMTWRECIENRKKIAEKIHEILIGEDSGSPFAESGITKLYIVIKEIELPEDLKKAITEPEIARLKALAKEHEGEGEKKYAKLKGDGEAEARKAIFGAIEGNVDKEVLLTLRQMAQGTSNTILFGLPPEIYETLARAMGGKRPEDLLKLLSKEAKEDLIKTLTAEIEGKKGGV
jgi:regulator of protease activity HflC (stomatin/prohibitin superfamily)